MAIENRLVVAKGAGGVREGRRGSFGLVDGFNNKVLLYSTGNYIQSPGINHNGKEYKKECICVYNRVTLLYSRN